MFIDFPVALHILLCSQGYKFLHMLNPGPTAQGSVTGRTVATARAVLAGRRAGVRGRLAFAGPAVIASIAYIDPGNFATNIQAGARYGYGGDGPGGNPARLHGVSSRFAAAQRMPGQAAAALRRRWNRLAPEPAVTT